MSDFILTSSDRGIYEIPLIAGAPVTVSIPAGIFSDGLIVLVHSGESPVYADFAATVAPKDSRAQMIYPAGAWATVVTGTVYANVTLAVVSATAANVSVFRA